MTAEARLALRCTSAKSAEGMAEVLAPDNTGFPHGQLFSTTRAGHTLSFSVKGDTLPSVCATVLSVLRDASLFQEIWLLSRGTDAEVGSHR